MRRKSKSEVLRPVSYKRWKSMVYKKQEGLIRSLSQGILQLLNMAEQKQLQAVSLHIIYVRTSVCNKRPYYRLYLLEEKSYNGNTDCWIYWEMPDLMRYIKDMFPSMEESCRLDYKKLEALMEQQRRKSAENLYLVMNGFIEFLMNKVMEDLEQEIYYPVYFGEYMDEQTLIYDPKFQIQ